VRTQHGRRPRFQCEAKRLHSDSSLGEYLGQDGLGRILNGDYAAQHPDAGMLGYVQSGTPEEWANKLESKLKDEDGPYDVLRGGGLRPMKLSRSLSHTFYSRHNRAPVKAPIDMYHTLLLFN
jgi:hypothetical protein